MKKNLCIFMLLTCSFVLRVCHAQSPVLTQSNTMPVLHTPYVMHQAATAGISFGSTGTAQNWDYSNLSDTLFSNTTVYYSPNETPAAALFSGANLTATSYTSATVQADSSYSYMKISADSLLGLGVYDTNDTVFYNKPLLSMVFPFSYGNTFEDSTVLYEHSVTGIDTSMIAMQVSATGNGTLQLPGNTYAQVLQISDTQKVYLPGGSGTATNIIQNYFANGYNNLLSISQSTIEVSGFTIVSRSVSYMPASVSLSLKLISFSAEKQNRSALLKWKTEDDGSQSRFVLEKGTDGRHFFTIEEQKASSQAGVHSYEVKDKNVPLGQCFYRLKIEGENNNAVYSRIATLSWPKQERINVYPNPAKSYVQIDNHFGKRLVIYALNGKTVLQCKLSTGLQKINIQSLRPGIYTGNIDSINFRFVKE